MYKKILVPLDGSELAECVLPHVEAFIKGFDISDVSFVRVVDLATTTLLHEAFSEGSEGSVNTERLMEFIEKRKSSFLNYLNQFSERFGQDGTVAHSEVLEGRVAEKLTEYAEKNGIDLIIIATHGRSGAKRWIMGSVADKLLRSSTVPIFMVRTCVPSDGI